MLVYGATPEIKSASTQIFNHDKQRDISKVIPFNKVLYSLKWKVYANVSEINLN